MNERFSMMFGDTAPVIGMLHAPPLPGSPGDTGDWASVINTVLTDAEALVSAGVDGLMLENFGDTPFYPGRVPAATIAHLTTLGVAVGSVTDIPLGINCLRNDGQSALAIAHACGAQFIRVNVLCGARVTDQGLLQGIAHDLLRDRAHLDADHIAILADVNVKHSAPVAAIPLDQEVHDLTQRGGADALVVSGSGTGVATDLGELQAVRDAAEGTPVLLGSGVSADNIAQYKPHADGFIVGTSLKTDGDPTHPVDPDRVTMLLNALGA